MRFDLTMEGIDSTIRGLNLMDKQVEKAVVSTLNKLGAQGITVGVAAITKVYNIKKSEAKKHLSLTKAQRSWTSKTGNDRSAKLYAQIRGVGKWIPLIKFGAIPNTVTSQKGKPRYASNRKGGRKRGSWIEGGAQYPGRKRVSVLVNRKVGRVKYRHLFIQKMPSGHVAIFERKKDGSRMASGSSAISERLGMGVSQMLQFEGAGAIKQLVREKGPRVLRHELDYYLGNIKGAKK